MSAVRAATREQGEFFLAEIFPRVRRRAWRAT
jgi:hypothetical protein